MLYDDIPSFNPPEPGIYAVLSFRTDKHTHITETTTHGYFQNSTDAKRKLQQVADYAAKHDADQGKEILLDSPTEFAYIDNCGDECHIIVHCAS